MTRSGARARVRRLLDRLTTERIVLLAGFVVSRIGYPLAGVRFDTSGLDYSSQLIFQPETRRFPSQLPTSNFQVGEIHFGWLDLAILAVSVLSVGALWLFLKYHRLGWAIRATRRGPT